MRGGRNRKVKMFSLHRCEPKQKSSGGATPELWGNLKEVSLRYGSFESVGVDPLAFGLADFFEEIGEPTLINVEGFATLDAREGNRAHDISVVFIEACDSAFSFQCRLCSVNGTRLDEF